VHGFTAVKAGDVYKIVRSEAARERAIPTITEPPPRPVSPPESGPRSDTTPPPDERVTQVVAPRFASAAALASVLRPLLSTGGSIVVHPHANVLLVTDTATVVGTFAEVVHTLDVELAAEELHVVQLRYADASHVADVLNQVFAGARLASQPVIVADRRTNSLIIRARPSELEAIGRMLGHD
jgi:type II secretory pathway component GspD/PulD (secretin)